MPGAAGASLTKRFKELLVMLVMSLRGVVVGVRAGAQVLRRPFRRQAKETAWVAHIN